jgi:hypothetical protein
MESRTPEKTEYLPTLRKTLLINPPFQYRFMFWMGALAFLSILLMHISHQWFFFNLRKQALLAGIPSGHVFFQFIQDQQNEMNWVSGLCFLGVCLLVAIFGLWLSHKIAGPMYRMKTHFQEGAKRGSPEPLHFREGDFFGDVAQAYNEQFNRPKTP